MHTVLQTWRLDWDIAPSVIAAKRLQALEWLGLTELSSHTLPNSPLVLDTEYSGGANEGPSVQAIPDLLAERAGSGSAVLQTVQRGVAQMSQQNRILLRAVVVEVFTRLAESQRDGLLVELVTIPGDRDATQLAASFPGTQTALTEGLLDSGGRDLLRMKARSAAPFSLERSWHALTAQSIQAVAAQFASQWAAESLDGDFAVGQFLDLFKGDAHFETKAMTWAWVHSWVYEPGPRIASLAWNRSLLQALNHPVQVGARRNFAKPSWSDYAATMVHQDTLKAAQSSYGGLAPLHYPPSYFPLAAFAGGIQQGCLVALQTSPEALALLQKRSPRYLTDIIATLSTTAGYRTEIISDQLQRGALTQAVGVAAGLLIGGVLAGCAAADRPFLPAQALLRAGGPLDDVLAFIRTLGQAVPAAPGLAAPRAVEQALAPVIQRYVWLASLDKAITALPAAHKKGYTADRLTAYAASDEFETIDPQSANLPNYAQRRARPTYQEFQRKRHSHYVQRLLPKTVPLFHYEGKRFFVRPPEASRAVPPSEALPTKFAGWLRALPGTAPAAGKKDPLIADMVPALEGYLEALQAERPLLAAIVFSQGRDTVMQSMRDQPPIPARHAVTFVKLCCANPVPAPALMGTVLDSVEDPLMVMGGHSLLDHAIDAPFPDAGMPSAVPYMCRHLQQRGAPAAYFQRSLERALSTQHEAVLTAILQQDVTMAPEQGAQFQRWHPYLKTAALQALVQAAEMRYAIREALALPREVKRPMPRTVRIDVL